MSESRQTGASGSPPVDNRDDFQPPLASPTIPNQDHVPIASNSMFSIIFIVLRVSTPFFSTQDLFVEKPEPPSTSQKHYFLGLTTYQPATSDLIDRGSSICNCILSGSYELVACDKGGASLKPPCTSLPFSLHFGLQSSLILTTLNSII